MQDRVSEAHDAFVRGEQLRSRTASGDDTDDLNRGIALRLLGRTHEAIEYYERALPEHPSAVAHGHYALALLTAGRFQEGWDQYAFRWLDGPLVSQRAKHARPEWTGQDLAGKTDRRPLRAGSGRCLPVRSLPTAGQGPRGHGSSRAAARPRSAGESFPGVDKAIRPGEPLPEFDFYVDLMSLPRVFGTTLHSIPAAVPYLHAPAHIRAAWRDRLGTDGSLKVGLVWSGDPRHARDRQRSIPLAELAPIIEVEGVRWFSLQKGAAAAELKQARFDRTIVDLGPDLYEYADTAAAIENLDLVVTVDTSVAHLAGALGKAVWVLLPYVADWRWLEGREDSPWYPTMRLFRQRAPDGWSEVIRRVAGALEERARTAHWRRAQSAWERRSPGTRDSPGARAPTRPEQSMRPPGISQGVPHPLRHDPVRRRTGPAVRSVEHYGEYLQVQVDVLARLVAPGSVVLETRGGNRPACHRACAEGRSRRADPRRRALEGAAAHSPAKPGGQWREAGERHYAGRRRVAPSTTWSSSNSTC